MLYLARLAFTAVTLALFVGAISVLMVLSCHPEPPVPVVPNAAAARGCAAGARPSLFCNRVTKGSPPHECAVCPARACLTATSIYCVASSCDDPACAERGK